jgi:hypothetical protein
MALLFSEGWDAYTTTSDVTGSGKYKVFRTSNNGGPQLLSSSGKYGGKAISSISVGYASAVRCDVNIASGATFYIGGWWKCGLSGGKDSDFGYGGLVNIGLASNGAQILDFDGNYLTLRNGTYTSTTPLATGTTYLGDGYHWIEASIQINGASTKVTAYVDSILQFTGTYNYAQAAQAITQLYVSTGKQAANGAASYLDDFIIWDGSGTSFNTFPIGPRRGKPSYCCHRFCWRQRGLRYNL